MRKLILVGFFLHFSIVVLPLITEIRAVIRDLPLLWGTTNEERRTVMLEGVLDSTEDHEFIARCKREIPLDADVLIVSNSMGNVYILNYYLYPRKTSVDKSALGKNHWIVHYFTPKALEKNRIEKPRENSVFD